jgi:hypothetical protein
MGRRIGTWAGIGATAVAAAVLVGFWLVAGLEPAGWLAGVVSAFLALFLAATALFDHARPRRPQRETQRPGAGETANRVDGGEFSGPVVMGRDISLGPGRDTDRASDPSAGSVSNTLSGGAAQGPVVMGRDISGEIVQGPAAPTPPPAPAPAPPAVPPLAPPLAPPDGGEARER